VSFTGDAATDGVVEIVITSIYVTGSGSSPFLSDDCGAATATPSPTMTPTPNPTFPPGLDASLICPDALVDPDTVSVLYQAQCSHCLISSASTSIYTPIYMTSTPLVTPTDVITVSTLSPPTATPAAGQPTAAPPVGLACVFDGNCTWMSFIYGSSVGTDLLHEDALTLSNTVYHRIVGFEVLNQGSGTVSTLPDIVGLRVFYDLTMPTYTGLNLYYSFVSGSGIQSGDGWLTIPAGIGGTLDFTSLVTIPRGTLYVRIMIFSSLDADINLLDGSVSLWGLEIDLLSTFGLPDDSFFGADTLCYAPENSLPASLGGGLFGFTGGAVSAPQCFTVFPEVDLGALLSYLPGISLPSFGVPLTTLCVIWWPVPDLILFGLEVDLLLIISGFVFVAFMRTLLRF